MHFIYGHHIEIEFEYTIKKKRFTGNTPFDYFIYVEGSTESKVHESYNNVGEGIYNVKQWSSGITYSSHMNDDIDIQNFALTVINDDTFKRKFFSSFISTYAADGLCFAIEKAMKDASDKLTDDDKKPVNEAIAKVREAIKADSIDEIKKNVEALNKENETIAQKIYMQKPTTENQTQEQSTDDKPVDAEVC